MDDALGGSVKGWSFSKPTIWLGLWHHSLEISWKFSYILTFLWVFGVCLGFTNAHRGLFFTSQILINITSHVESDLVICLLLGTQSLSQMLLCY